MLLLTERAGARERARVRRPGQHRADERQGLRRRTEGLDPLQRPADAVRAGRRPVRRVLGQPGRCRHGSGGLMFGFFFTPKAENDKYVEAPAQLGRHRGVRRTEARTRRTGSRSAGRTSASRCRPRRSACAPRTSNQPVEVAALRPQFASLLGLGRPAAGSGDPLRARADAAAVAAPAGAGGDRLAHGPRAQFAQQRLKRRRLGKQRLRRCADARHGLRVQVPARRDAHQRFALVAVRAAPRSRHRPSRTRGRRRLCRRRPCAVS
ncbi:MAG: hypothetical protein MZW92_41190 [Comamonadaceae bacterium]|nr:hypothetical protein [Comamonadaceae bacterium]